MTPSPPTPRLPGPIMRRFQANPSAWILLALLAFSVWSHYRTGQQLTLVCRLTGPHNVAYGNPVTYRQQVDTICAGRED